jgi:hypothetical protein
MSKYNFQVKATITCFVQRECNSDEEAEEIKEMLENDRWALNEIMHGTDTELDDTEVLVYGENEY